MDGRIQEPLLRYIRDRYGVEFVDTITEPGPCAILAGDRGNPLARSISNRIDISLDRHGSRLICISGHHDCAGNPVPRSVQEQQIRESADILRKQYPQSRVVMLWINEEWQVEEL